MPAHSDGPRPRGVLSESDRRYLRDPEAYADEHSRQSLQDRRKAIRKRTRNAVLDFYVLQEYLDEDLRDLIFGGEAQKQQRLWGGMVAATALFYEIHEREGWDFGHFLESVVDQMWQTVARAPTGKARAGEIAWDPPLEDRRAEARVFVTAEKKFRRGDPLTNRELGVLVKHGGRLVDENLDVLRERLQEISREEWREDTADQIDTRAGMFEPGEISPPDTLAAVLEGGDEDESDAAIDDE